jgi:hypothetical protein
MDRKEIHKKIQIVIDSMKDDVYNLGPDFNHLKQKFEYLLVLDLKSNTGRDIALKIVNEIIVVLG